MSKLCTKCNIVLQEDAKFCSECGDKVEETCKKLRSSINLPSQLEGLYLGKPRHLKLNGENLILREDIKEERFNDVEIELEKIIAIKFRKYVCEEKLLGVALFCKTEREVEIDSTDLAIQERNCFVFRSNKSNLMIESITCFLEENSPNYIGTFVFKIDADEEAKRKVEELENNEKLMKERDERIQENNIVRCPICQSTNLSANKKGF